MYSWFTVAITILSDFSTPLCNLAAQLLYLIDRHQLLLRMHTEFFCTGSIVAGAEETADRLMIIVSGRIRIYLGGRAGRRSGLLLTLGPG